MELAVPEPVIRTTKNLYKMSFCRYYAGLGGRKRVIWDGKGLPPLLKAEILRESQRVDMVQEQIMTFGALNNGDSEAEQKKGAVAV